MTNTIKASEINNRKIILEVRFETDPTVIDNRGKLLQKFIASKIINNAQWELGIAEIKFGDSLEENKCKQLIFADLNRITIVSARTETNEGFFHLVEKAFGIFSQVMPNIKIIRIGCRIQGTYNCKNNDYNRIVNSFTKIFPSQILLEDYNVKDMRFQLIYQNGQYNIGPINKDDAFVKVEFPFVDSIKRPGFAIDTDNYMTKDVNYLKDASIKDVYTASLAVESSLFEKLYKLL
jgi:hypothetical protein